MKPRRHERSAPPSPPPASTTAGQQDACSRCVGRTPDGRACGARPHAGSRYCFFHDPEAAEARLEARRAGGRERTRPSATVPETDTDLRLQSVAEITHLLADTINRVRKGTIEVKIANTVGYLAGVLVRAFEVGELEARLVRLEGVTDRAPAGPSGAFATELIEPTDLSHHHEEEPADDRQAQPGESR